MLKLSARTTQFALAATFAAVAASSAFAQADNSNSKVAPASSFSNWMMEHSKSNQGRISRDAYMQESGRRWDAMDQKREGLTSDQVNGLYGYQTSPSAPAGSNSMGSPMSMPKDTMTAPTGPTNVKK